MSHFTKLRTVFTNEDYLLKALRILEYKPLGAGLLRGYLGNMAFAHIRIQPTPDSYDIGFRKEGETYICVADWYGVDIDQETFLHQLKQEYAAVCAKERLAVQGFYLAKEERTDGQIHLVLRKTASIQT